MTRTEAADLLDNLIGMVEDNQENDYDTALKMASEALKRTDKRTKTHECDCISRQEVVESFTQLWDCVGEIADKDEWEDVCKTTANELPSAQPEVIRCTECKHYREYDSEYVENAVVVQCMADRYPISETIPDGWFCAGAERRTDE